MSHEAGKNTIVETLYGRAMIIDIKRTYLTLDLGSIVLLGSSF